MAALLALALAATGTGCATTAGIAHPAFVVLRHAEKQDDGTGDPSLSSEGQARAALVAARLGGMPLRQAWASQYARTLQTAAPAATVHGLAVERYDAATPAAEFARRLVAAHPGGTVLVVGHSNTVPELVAALCGCGAAPLDEADYDRWFELRPDADGRLLLQETRF